jgi:hypothetical protein
MRKEHDLPIGEFECVVVREGIVQVDLPKPRDGVMDHRLVPPKDQPETC